MSRLRLSARHRAAACVALAVAAVADAHSLALQNPRRRVAHGGLRRPAIALDRPRAASTHFWERLRELGYVEGQNLVIEARWADGRYDRLPALMAEVLGRKSRCARNLWHASRGGGQERDQHDPDRRRGDGRAAAHWTRHEPGAAQRQSDRALGGVDRRYGRQVAGIAAGDGSAALHRRRDREPGQPDGPST